MNIIELARQSGFFISTEMREVYGMERFERFANAVIAAHESKRIAELEALNHGLQNRNDHLQERIAELESTLKVALDSLENSIDCVRAEYETDWRHGMPTRKAQLDSMKQDYEAHEAVIKQIKEVLHGSV